jgi:hypothetical protein
MVGVSSHSIIPLNSDFTEAEKLWPARKADPSLIHLGLVSDNPRTRQSASRGIVFCIHGDKARTLWSRPGGVLSMIDGLAADMIEHEAAGI